MRDCAALLGHRGPDDDGFWSDPAAGIALAHRRLSIIDLTAAGRQPLEDGTGVVRVVLNGEIYNFRELRQELEKAGARFRTATDTEVLLAAYVRWGSAFLERLEGMFAFALYDARSRQLLLARDRVGEKPLYYQLDGRGLRFASELKALMEAPGATRRVDAEALEHYLAFGYVPAPLSILQGYRKLCAGEALSFDLETGRSRRWRYWRLPEASPLRASIDELTDELAELLEASVRRQLVADVPVGVLLSGGLDSSLVTAFAARQSSAPLRTFTVAFPGHATHDESRFARAVAEHYGTRHTELVAEPATADLMPVLARQYDEPFADSSMIPTYLVARQIRNDATVALGGDGGDELFGGYPHYSWMQWQQRIRRLSGPARHLGSSLGSALPVGTRGRNHLIALGADPRRSVAHINLLFDARSRATLRGRATIDERPELFKMGLWREQESPALNAMRIDFLTYLPDDLLVKVDRASMLASLEVRAPFLDRRLIEFAFGRLPERMRVAGRERKILSRRLAARLLPPSHDLRRKQGFSLPLNAWFRGEWGQYVRGILLDAPAGQFDRSFVQALLNGQERGRSNTQRLYALAMLELWRREYGVDFEDAATRAAAGNGALRSTAIAHEAAQ